MSNIVVIGSLNMDLVTQTEKVPIMGETLTGTAFRTVCGGKGGNQAFAAARLGGNVTMLGCVGSDGFGKELIHSLKEQGVDCSQIGIVEGVESGIASITVCQGDNSIIIIPGANEAVTVDYIKQRLDVIRTADFIVLQLEIPLETVEYIVNFASDVGIPVMLNPAPAKELPEKLFSKMTCLIVNETECEFYTGIVVDSVESAKIGLQKILEKGIAYGIVTIGSQGAVFNDGKEIYHEPARKVQAVDSTAAGDTFSAAVVVSLLEGKSIKEAISFATKASSIVVTRVGAQSSIPSREEVDAI